MITVCPHNRYQTVSISVSFLRTRNNATRVSELSLTQRTKPSLTTDIPT